MKLDILVDANALLTINFSQTKFLGSWVKNTQIISTALVIFTSPPNGIEDKQNKQ